MTVKTMYVVERKGEEVLNTANKKEADAYDKMLDISDEIYELFEDSDIEIDDKTKEDLSIYIAKNKEVVAKLLKGQKLNKEEK